GSITPGTRERAFGKTGDLACGYQGGEKAIEKFAPGMFSLAEREKIKTEWRAAHPAVCKFWYAVDHAAWTAVQQRGRIVSCGPVAFKCCGNFLFDLGGSSSSSGSAGALAAGCCVGGGLAAATPAPLPEGVAGLGAGARSARNWTTKLTFEKPDSRPVAAGCPKPEAAVGFEANGCGSDRGLPTMTKPTTHQGNLAKLPRALTPLLGRKQWCIWQWTPKPDGSWQKPPFIATHPDRHANTRDPSTWTDYITALAAVQTGHGDGISYVLTADDPFAAIDLDHCRDDLGGVDIWAQLFLERGRNTYSEVTPSGTGCRIWGLASGEKLHRKFDLVINDTSIAAELFRRTNKALT